MATAFAAPVRMAVTQAQRDAAQAEYERCVRENQDLSFWYPSRQREVVERFDRGEAAPPHLYAIGNAEDCQD